MTYSTAHFTLYILISLFAIIYGRYVMNVLSKTKRAMLSVWICFIFFVQLGVASHHPMVELNAIRHSTNVGKGIYTHYCAMCHANHPQISLGAPRFRIKKDWKRYDNLPFTDIIQLMLEGVQLMPPRGGCFECTDAELLKALYWMNPDFKKHSNNNILNQSIQKKR
jgi:cytochrome c5